MDGFFQSEQRSYAGFFFSGTDKTGTAGNSGGKWLMSTSEKFPITLDYAFGLHVVGDKMNALIIKDKNEIEVE